MESLEIKHTMILSMKEIQAYRMILTTMTICMSRVTLDSKRQSIINEEQLNLYLIKEMI